MPIADVARCKRYVRIPAGTTVNDTIIEELLESAKAMVEGFLKAPLEDDRTVVIATGWPNVRSVRREQGASSVTTTTVTTPLSEEPDYETRILPIVNQALVDTVAAYYGDRAPTAASESEGGGVGTSWSTEKIGASGLPLRVERSLSRLIA